MVHTITAQNLPPFTFLGGPSKLDRVVIFETNNNLGHFVITQNSVKKTLKLFFGHALNHCLNQLLTPIGWTLKKLRLREENHVSHWALKKSARKCIESTQNIKGCM